MTWHAVTIHLPDDLYAQAMREAARDKDTLAEWARGAVTHRLAARRRADDRRHKAPPVECRQCGRQRRHRARGLCERCYQQEMARQPKPCRICHDCGQARPHHARGLCEGCYSRHQYAGTLGLYRRLRRKRAVAA